MDRGLELVGLLASVEFSVICFDRGGHTLKTHHNGDEGSVMEVRFQEVKQQDAGRPSRR